MYTHIHNKTKFLLTEATDFFFLFTLDTVTVLLHCTPLWLILSLSLRKLCMSPLPECRWNADTTGVSRGLQGRSFHCTGTVTLWWPCVARLQHDTQWVSIILQTIHCLLGQLYSFVIKIWIHLETQAFKQNSYEHHFCCTLQWCKAAASQLQSQFWTRVIVCVEFCMCLWVSSEFFGFHPPHKNILVGGFAALNCP